MPCANETSSMDPVARTGEISKVSIQDPNCDRDNPRSISYLDIEKAAQRIEGKVVRTPCMQSNMSDALKMVLFFKHECLQKTNSFKERGARNALENLSPEQRTRGVIAASAGNHALALAYHGFLMGVHVTVVMPVNAPQVKVSRCKQYKATIIMHGKDLNEGKEYALKLAAETGLLYINGYDHPDILAGQGTIGLEIIQDIPDVDAIIVPVGGGGLIAGTALSAKTFNPAIKIIGVEAECSPTFNNCLVAGRQVYTPCGPTIADGLSVALPGVNALETVRQNKLVDKMVAVNEEHIALAIMKLVESDKIIVEGAGAVGMAAILGGYLPELEGKKVVIVLSGANIDTSRLYSTIEMGLALDGRLTSFEVVMKDQAGSLHELTSILAQAGVNIKSINVERSLTSFYATVKVVVETRSRSHVEELKKMLSAKFEKVLTGVTAHSTNGIL